MYRSVGVKISRPGTASVVPLKMLPQRVHFLLPMVQYGKTLLTTSSTPSTGEDQDHVTATHGGETTDDAHDCDLTIFDVDITTPTSTAMDITTAPAMPSATFHADIEPEDILSKATFKWHLNMTFNHDTLGELTHTVPTSGTYDVEGSEDWTPNWGDLLAGGDVHVYVKASVSGSSEDEDDQGGYQIRGTNPTQSQIFGIADLIEERAVCWKESSHRQFNATRYTGIGMPLASFAEDGGYGLMQPTPASEGQVWNWNTNLSWGVDYLNTCHTNAQNYLNTWYDPEIWSWDPSDPANSHLVWDDAFARYGPKCNEWGYTSLYSPSGHDGVINSDLTCMNNYSSAVRGIINSPPW
jgi:hypothetical protein